MKPTCFPHILELRMSYFHAKEQLCPSGTLQLLILGLGSFQNLRLALELVGQQAWSLCALLRHCRVCWRGATAAKESSDAVCDL